MTEDHANRDPQAADADFAIHDGGLAGDAWEVGHERLL